MPSINMIAARGAERKRLEKMIYFAFLAIVVELAVMCFLFGFMTTRLFAAGRQIDRLDKDLAQIQPTVDKIHGYEAEIEKLRPRLSLLADSREQTLTWYTVMQDLSRSMPQETWLSSVMTTQPPVRAGSEEKPAPVVSLRGIAANQSLVGETMLRLNQCSEFERIDLSYTQNNESRAKDCVEFQIAALMKSNEPKKEGVAENAKD